MWFTDAATVGASAVRWSRSSREARVEGAARGEIYNMHDSRERVDTGVHFIKFEVASGSPYLLTTPGVLTKPGRELRGTEEAASPARSPRVHLAPAPQPTPTASRSRTPN